MKPSDYIRKGWCRLACSVFSDGRKCLPWDPDASAWCIAGAIRAAYSDLTERMGVWEEFRRAHRMSVVTFNDHKDCTQDLAIQALESIGQ